MVGFIVKLLLLYEFILLIRVLLTWLPHDPAHPGMSVIYKLADPPLNLAQAVFFAAVRRFGGNPEELPVDFSPVLVFMLIEIIKRLLYAIF